MDGTDLLTISQIADRCGIATSAVRYYEKRGLIESTRTEGNQRRFVRETIRRISFITAAQAVGRTLEEITDALADLPAGRTPTADDWSVIARAWRPRLDEQIARLVDLRDKLDACIGCGCLSFDRCRIYNRDDVAQRQGSGPRYLLGDESG